MLYNFEEERNRPSLCLLKSSLSNSHKATQALNEFETSQGKEVNETIS